jgi:transcriptional regulator with XRE-family HTH domain
MTDYSETQIVDAGETLAPLHQSALDVLREIDSGYSTQQSIADELGIGRSTVSKYMNQSRDAPVPLIESSGHNSWTSDHAQYILETLDKEEVDLMPHTDKRRTDVASATLHEAQTGDTIPQLQRKVEDYSFDSPRMYEGQFLPDYFEHGVFDLKDDIIEVTEKGEIQKDILHKTADQLVEEVEPEDKYRLAVYLAKETEDGLEPVQPVEGEFTEDEIIDLLNQQNEK